MAKRGKASSSSDVPALKGLETLLSLDGEIFPMENGYWTKFEVKQVTPTNIFRTESATA